MQIDGFTVLVSGLFAKALLAALFLAFWLVNRYATWFLWWSLTFLFATAANVLFVVRGFGAEIYAVGIAVAFLIAGFAACWQAARAFERRKILWTPVLAAPTIWLGACLIPGFLQDVASRVVLSSLILALMSALTAFEFWRGRREELPSRGIVIVLFASITILMLSRIAMLHTVPFPFGALPEQLTYVAAFNLILFFHTILLAILLVAMTKERLELDQRNKAQTDPLTGALNRRALMTKGERLVRRHQMEGKHLCLLYLDIDHFKALNDRVGHSGGDDVLNKFVEVVHDNIRPTDLLFRIGGEEFCCLLSYTALPQAERVAERIRQQVERMVVEIPGSPEQVTVSIGLASTDPYGYDLDGLMRLADKAVYDAKRQGRNRVVAAMPPEPLKRASGQ
jgi:diguanylate cyclase (GGDEF)-like protein